ncbi:MAG: AAA family ATPase [Telluria sp.]
MSDLKIFGGGRCQFCLGSASDEKRLIAGNSAFICDECVERCSTVLRTLPQDEKPKPSKDRYLYQRIAKHFAPLPPQELLATSRTYPLRQQADLQNAVDELLGERIIAENFVGIHQQYRHDELCFSKLLERGHNALEAAPAQYEEVAIGNGETARCLKNGLWLPDDERGPYAVVLTQKNDFHGGGDLVIEVAAPPGQVGAELCTYIFDALEQRLSKGSCYRGRVLSLEQPYMSSGHSARISVHTLEPVSRDDVILPESTLRAVERNILQFAEQRQALRDMGLSTQKGLLFHGAPGTGKTHCIRYLAGALKGHTTFLITAEGSGLLPEYMALARLLQPALVVIEDADLIARDRSERANACDEVMLNRLLNEMDGLRERADVFFILTTNRPETLEPALASRPGRIDQTIEFPLPDENHRRRLIELYAKTLPVPAKIMDELARRTDQASPAFIKELMRRIAQHHLETRSDDGVSRETAESALHEMLFSGGSLNTRLLGGAGVDAGTNATR